MILQAKGVEVKYQPEWERKWTHWAQGRRSGSCSGYSWAPKAKSITCSKVLSFTFQKGCICSGALPPSSHSGTRYGRAILGLCHLQPKASQNVERTWSHLWHVVGAGGSGTHPFPRWLEQWHGTANCQEDWGCSLAVGPERRKRFWPARNSLCHNVSWKGG